MTKPSFNERLDSLRAIAEALVGVPIVLAQQIAQNVGDIKLDSNTTLEQRLGQLRNLGEMTVRFGSRGVRQRFGDKPR